MDIAYSGEIRLDSKNHSEIYGFKKNDIDENDRNLKRTVYRTEKEINGISYKCNIINKGYLSIYVKNNDGDEIKFTCEEYLRENVLMIKNEMALEQYIIGLKDNVSVKEVFEKICELIGINEYCYRNISLGFYKNGDMQSGYSVIRRFSDKVKIETKEDGIYKSYCFEKGYALGSDKKFNINFLCGDYSIEFETLSFLNSKDVLQFGGEYKLREYLLNLKFPVSIDELYRKFCEIFLGDVSKCFYTKLSVYNCSELTDMIHLEEDRLQYFMMTKDGKVSSVDKDGKFSYMTEDEKSLLTLDIDNDTVTRYEYIVQDGININLDDMNKKIQTVDSEAKNAKVRTRNIINELLNKNDSN